MKIRIILVFMACILVLPATAFGADGLTLSDVQNAIKAKGADWVAGETGVSKLTLYEKANLCGVPQEPPPEPEETWTPPPETVIPIGTFDWRNVNGMNWMTPVKNQNPCGTCWDYCAIGVIEAQVNIDRNDPDVDVDLSEQMTLSCWPGPGKAHTTPWCSGGWPHYTFDQARNEGGIPDEACFPDTCKTNSCPAGGRPCAPCSDWESRAWTISSYPGVSPHTVAAYKAALQYGPLAVCFEVPDDWYFYKSGVYSPTIKSPEWAELFEPGQPNHCVVLVGYSDPGHDPMHPQGYWIVKNSWGPGWGTDGYGAVIYGGFEQYAYCYRVVGTTGPSPAIDLTLYYDWGKDGTFASSSLQLYPGSYPVPFTTGDGGSGFLEFFIGDAMTLDFKTGCCPMYTGPWYGYMDCKDGACGNEPGWFYVGGPTAAQATNRAGRSADGSPFPSSQGQ